MGRLLSLDTPYPNHVNTVPVQPLHGYGICGVIGTVLHMKPGVQSGYPRVFSALFNTIITIKE